MQKNVQFIIIDTVENHNTFQTYPTRQLDQKIARLDGRLWQQRGDKYIVGSLDGISVFGTPSDVQPTDPYLCNFDLIW